MSKTAINSHIKGHLNAKLSELEKHFKSDVVLYYWEINAAYIKSFRDFIEELKTSPIKENWRNQSKLIFVLNTPGWSVETVEKMVEIIRHHYSEVEFIVPDYAMSAGTILCMSWDKIHMDYSSSLGPIDPQIFSAKENRFVPALGYIDKVAEIIQKSNDNEVSPAELYWLQAQDFAMLRSCEQARELSIKLLEEWLVKYKFKSRNTHRTNSPGTEVTDEEKIARAKQVANILSDNREWSSHGRFIGIDKLSRIVKIEIDNYSEDQSLSNLIREYNDLVVDYLHSYNIGIFLHSRCFI